MIILAQKWKLCSTLLARKHKLKHLLTGFNQHEVRASNFPSIWEKYTGNKI